MSFRTTALLFGIMIGVLWLYGLMLTYQRTRLDEGFLIPTLAKDRTAEIDTVTVEHEGQKFKFFKTTAGWRLRIGEHPQALRVEDGKVDEIIRDLTGARKTEETDVTRDLARWGLDKPATKVILQQKGGGKEWTLHVGKESPDGGFLYVNSSDHPDDVMAVRKAKLKGALVTAQNVNEYRARQLLEVSDLTARRVDLKPAADAKGRELILEKGTGAAWLFKKPPYGPAEYEGAAISKEPTGVRGLLNTLRGIKVERDADFEPLSTPAFAADKATLTIVLDRSGDPGQMVKETLLIGPKAPARKGGKENEEAGAGQYYARLADEQTVVRVDARNVETLLALARKPDALRSHDLAQVETGKPNVVRVRSGKGLADVMTLYKQPLNEWRVAAGALKHKANEAAIQGPTGLLTAVQAKNQVKDFFDVDNEAKEGAAKDKELGFDSPTAQVQLWTNGLEKEAAKGKDEKKAEKGKKGAKDETKKAEKEAPKAAEGAGVTPKGPPLLTLTFGKKVGDLVYVKRAGADGAISRVSVPASVLQKVVPAEGALAYLDPNVSPYLSADIAKLELKVTEGKVERTFVVEREDEKKDVKKAKIDLTSGWLLLQPKDFKDRPYADRDEVQSVLAALTRLTAQKYVERVEGKKDLGKYGLEPAAVTAIVTLQKKDGQKEPTTYTYRFGKAAKAAKGKAGVYAVVTGGDLQDIVFEAASEPFETLKKAELRDRTVFRFAPSKVKEVRLTIRSKEGLTLSPVFARKDKSWVVAKGLEEFNLDPASVDQLVQTLSDLRALRYVSFGGPTKEQGLTEKPRLHIAVVLDDKTTYTLTVGAAQDATGYYAESSALPRTVFLIARPHLEGLVEEGVAHFRQK